MLKRYVSFLIVVFILFGSLSCAYAHDGQEEHDEDLWGVLFGEGVYLTPDQEARFKAIADAAALCIDQFSANETIKSKEGLFNELNHRIGFSFGFADIELQKGSVGMNITARTHRHYTHRGWDFPEYPLKELWEQRKKILTATVNKEIFGYSPGILAKLSFAEGILYKETACNDECEAFCKLVYYVHILGDYEAAKTYSAEFQQLIPLVRHEDPRNPALIDELISIVPILFKNQPQTYRLFIEELDKVKQRAEEIVFVQGGIRTQEQFEEYKKCAIDLLAILKDKDGTPRLLKNTDYFNSAFYE